MRWRSGKEELTVAVVQLEVEELLSNAPLLLSRYGVVVLIWSRGNGRGDDIVDKA
jgi:hypothetical protein